MGLGNGFVHAVQAAHEGRFAAAGRTDDGRGMVGLGRHVDIAQGLGLAEPGVQVFDLDANTHTLVCSLERSPAGGQADRAYRSDDQHNQDQRARPRLAMPFIEGRNGVVENLQ